MREHRAGDPFKRIAWRASARRGKLMVREMEHDERDLVWVVLDASVELWSGRLGRAPLDLLIDDAAAAIDRHLRQGDRVGLVVASSRELVTIPPGGSVAHGLLLLRALATATGTIDRDRSDLDEADVALRVVEHLRPLDSNGLADVSRRDLDKLAQRAAATLLRAPFTVEAPDAPTLRERKLRQYLAAFGVESPPRDDPEHAKTVLTLTKTLKRLAETRPRPSIVIIAAPPPTATVAELTLAVRRLTRSGAAVRWIVARYEPGLDGLLDDGRSEAAVLVRATIARLRVGATRGARLLRSMGVRVERPGRGALAGP